MAWTVNNLVHGKGLTSHLFGCIPPHLLCSGFLQGKGDGGLTTGGTASLPAAVPVVRKVMVTPAWALPGDIREPSEASSLVLPLTLVCSGTVVRLTPTFV